MKKSSDIYDIAWDLAKLVDTLDDAVICEMSKDSRKSGSSADIQNICLNLNAIKQQMVGIVRSLEDITDSLEEIEDNENSPIAKLS